MSFEEPSQPRNEETKQESEPVTERPPQDAVEQINLGQESTRIEKEAKLQAMRQEVNDWADRLGERVDAGIKEIVAVFNVIGIPTSASCEGHSGSDHGYPAPWVEVEAPDEPDWRFEHQKEIYEQVAKKHGITVDEVLHADNDEAWVEAMRLSAEQEETAEYRLWQEKNQELFEKAEALLREFYKERDASDEIHIKAYRSVDGFRIHNGGKFSIPNNEKERLQNELTEEDRGRIPEVLKASQQEMNAFTEFLKEKYFGENLIAGHKSENMESRETEEQVNGSLETVSDLGVVKVYDNSGKFVFSGNPDQLVVFLKNKDYGTAEDIGGISDEEGKSIFRFGRADGRGFTDRKRIEGLFQQLESKVASKKRAAEDAQKLGEFREQIGAQQETPVAPQVEQPAEAVLAAPEQIESRTENQLERENLFDSDKAKQIVDVAKDWVKYGGNFYDHLTGKNVKLEKGVDYKVNPDGTPDMASYREARQLKIDAWLQEPSNQAWLAAGPKFEQDHKQELGYGQETVDAKQPDGTIAKKERYTTPYFYENGWLYYESNYFDKQKGELRQPDRESTKYRVYFNVESGDILPTYQEVIDQLNNDPELQKLGFQIKTADVSKVSPREVGQIMNQKDRIVLYLGEKGMEKALPILQKYAEQNRQKFNREGVLLAQPLADSQGQEISGITITSETKGRSPDPAQFAGEYKSFSNMQSKVVESSFRSLITALKNPKTFEGMSAKYPTMKENLSKLSATASQEDFVKGILADPNGEEFLTKNLQAIYPQWAKAFGMKERNIAFKKI